MEVQNKQLSQFESNCDKILVNEFKAFEWLQLKSGKLKTFGSTSLYHFRSGNFTDTTYWAQSFELLFPRRDLRHSKAH